MKSGLRPFAHRAPPGLIQTNYVHFCQRHICASNYTLKEQREHGQFEEETWVSFIDSTENNNKKKKNEFIDIIHLFKLVY